jgi:class 3 adenylate cyclase
MTADRADRQMVAGMGQFPDQNPHPVLRMAADGTLLYANSASAPVTAAWGGAVGAGLPHDVAAALRATAAESPPGTIEVASGGRTFDVLAIHVPELDAYNLYGTDVTARKAIDKFPNQNPNPVLRLTRAGRMTYANPASGLVRKALGAEVGEDLDPGVFARVIAASEQQTDPTMEVAADGTIYRLRVVSVYEFDSINLYGTDITAVRRVEELGAANEALLLNILPASIADRLRNGEGTIADRFDDMAVLFADVVGFTELSSRLAPTEVVHLLNEVFSTCDRLADRFGLEKIKTVGDAYMVVGGLPQHADEHSGRAPHGGSHAVDVADMGLAMLEELARHEHAAGVGLMVRLGMHVGPAVAGVIGLKKFIYDVWGDTVNMASRMEATGVPGRLQVTSETRERLAGAFEFERRGIVEVKGKGPLETWFVVRRRTAES